MSRLSALLIARDDVTDRRVWSGIPWSMYEALKVEFEWVVRCDFLGYPRGRYVGLEDRLFRLVGVNPYWRRGAAQYYARQIGQRLAEVRADWDVAVIIDTFMVLPCLRLDKPAIYLSDCTKTQLVDFKYPGFDQVSPDNHRRLMEMERLAYHNGSVLAFSSQWAAESAIRQYGVPTEKVRVVPFGANINSIPPRDKACIDGPWLHTKKCELLMIGVHWERKGGDIAKRIMECLNRQGVKCRLAVCGVVPPYPPDPNIRVFPFLDKNKPGDRARLEELLSEASYLVAPTQADCSPIVFCEAFAYGLPVITCNVGGVPEIVTHGVNGFVLNPRASAEEFANLIVENYKDREAYLRFRKAARDAYEATFNWQHWGSTVYKIAQELLVS